MELLSTRGSRMHAVNNRRRTTATLIVVACLLGAGAGVATATQTWSAWFRDIPPHQSPRIAAQTATATPTAMARIYPVLAHARRASDDPPAGAIGPFALSRGAVASQARLAATTPQAEQLFVVPATGATCLVSSDHMINGCSPYPILTQNEIVGGTQVCGAGEQLEFAALLPGSPSDALVHFSDGSSRAVGVTNGIVVVSVPRTDPIPESVSWQTGATTQTADTGAPADAASTACH
jgi:hypothetical protein